MMFTIALIIGFIAGGLVGMSVMCLVVAASERYDKSLEFTVIDKATDMINHPPHYNQGKYEIIDIIESILGEKFIGYLIGNVIKYISRYEYKGGATDLEKAAWYLNKAIEVYKEGN